MKRLIPLLLILAGCTSATQADLQGPPPSSVPTGTAITQGPPPGVAAPTASLLPVSAITIVHDPGHVTGHVNGPCHTRDNGQLPDAVCTPGSVDPTMTKEKLCAPGYTTSTYRATSSQIYSAKVHDILPAYGMTTFHGEIDHLISLELGGSNDESNLWPEAGRIPNEKDGIENILHAKVCAGKISLSEAQAEIAQDWLDVKV